MGQAPKNISFGFAVPSVGVFVLCSGAGPAAVLSAAKRYPKRSHKSASAPMVPLYAARVADLGPGDRDGELVWLRIRRTVIELQAEPSGPAH